MDILSIKHFHSVADDSMDRGWIVSMSVRCVRYAAADAHAHRYGLWS